MIKKFCVVVVLLISVASSSKADSEIQASEIKVGWIGGMTGNTAKWMPYEAAQMAVDDINAGGGVAGKKLRVIFEDGHCNGKSAVTAFNKLVDFDHVSFILGGHCSPESMAIAPLAEHKKIISIAAITSTPKLTSAGNYIFRVTAISTALAEIMTPYMYEELAIRKLAIVHENTDYVVPPAEKLNELFKKTGGEVVYVSSFNPGETDFRAILTKIKNKKVDGLYIGVQAPDTASILLKQARDLGIDVKLFGNEVFASAFNTSTPEGRSAFNGLIFAESLCDTTQPTVKTFFENFKARFHVNEVPFGCYTAEAYDTVKILANALSKCNDNGECVKNDLYRLKDYAGASGAISFNENGDNTKPYVLKQIVNDTIVEIRVK